MNALGFTWLCATKDLRILLRTRGSIARVCVLGVMIVMVLSLALKPSATEGSGGSPPPALWLAYVVVAVLGFECTARVDREERAIDALRLCPAAPGAAYFGKLLVNVVVLCFSAAAVTLAAMLLFGLDTARSAAVFVRVLPLSLLGLAALGTLFSAGLTSGTLRSELLTIVVLPLALPLIIVSMRLLERSGSGAATQQDVGILIAFDVMYIAVGAMAYQPLIEA